MAQPLPKPRVAIDRLPIRHLAIERSVQTLFRLDSKPAAELVVLLRELLQVRRRRMHRRSLRKIEHLRTEIRQIVLREVSLHVCFPRQRSTNPSSQILTTSTARSSTTTPTTPK